MAKMKNCGLMFLMLTLLSAAMAQAAPVVSNVRASQRTDGTGRVDIYYDVTGGIGQMIVSVVISNDNGATWKIIPNVGTLTGDTGTGITNGTGKHIVWEAGRDRADVYWPQAKVKIIAGEIGGTLTVMLPGGVPLELVRIPAGTFMMGSGLDPGYSSSTEFPQHQVSLNYDYYMGKYEVTQQQWYAVMASNPSQHTGNGNLPVEYVSWNDCQTFISKLNLLGLGTFRLPSEAEWEYACRAGTNTRWSFGDDPTQLINYAWYSANAVNQTHPVGSKLPNPFGLYDMNGNVYEWCEDDGHDTYVGAPLNGIAWIDSPSRGIYRSYRGGCWYSDASYCRSASRSYQYIPDYRYYSLGFRLARTF